MIRTAIILPKWFHWVSTRYFWCKNNIFLNHNHIWIFENLNNATIHWSIMRFCFLFFWTLLLFYPKWKNRQNGHLAKRGETSKKTTSHNVACGWILRRLQTYAATFLKQGRQLEIWPLDPLHCPNWVSAIYTKAYFKGTGCIFRGGNCQIVFAFFLKRGLL